MGQRRTLGKPEKGSEPGSGFRTVLVDAKFQETAARLRKKSPISSFQAT